MPKQIDDRTLTMVTKKKLECGKRRRDVTSGKQTKKNRNSNPKIFQQHDIIYMNSLIWFV